ncbi:hypothetical protein LXN99_21780, partial [Escherichia coli]|nr:hypothetical protein [Escherichia coli]
AFLERGLFQTFLSLAYDFFRILRFPLVEGSMRNTQYESNGQKVYGIDYIAENIQYLNIKSPASSSAVAGKKTD